MMFFWWRKYEDSWLATLLSYVGTVIVAIISITVMPLILFSGGSDPSDTLSIVAFFAMIIVFVLLKFLLNRLTDSVALKDIEKKTVEESVTNLKIEEIFSDFSNITEVSDDEVAEIIKPLNNGEPIEEQPIENNFVNIHNAFCFRSNIIFKTSSREKNGVLLTIAYGGAKPTDITILIQAFPLTNPDDFSKIANHFLKSYWQKCKPISLKVNCL